MAVNKKISDLTADASPAYGDFVPTLDISDTTDSAQGTTKKVTKKNFQKLAVATKTSGPYTVLDTDDVLIANSASALTFNLPAGATRGTGSPYYFKNINTGLLTLDGNSTQTIDGSLTFDLGQGDKVMLVWDGTGWQTI